MRVGVFTSFVVAALITWPVSLFSQPLTLSLRPGGAQVELSWPASITNSVQGALLPEYEVQYSTDLVSWLPLGGKVRGITGLSGPTLQLSLNQQAGPVFYRVIADTNSTAVDETGSGGAQVFGYDSAFLSNLNALGQLSVQDFATNAGNIAYLPQLTWDPTTAQYWTSFNSTNLLTDQLGMIGGSLSYNYLLDSNEFGLFMTNGFVVSERLGSASFGDAYYRIFKCGFASFYQRRLGAARLAPLVPVTAV